MFPLFKRVFLELDGRRWWGFWFRSVHFTYFYSKGFTHLTSPSVIFLSFYPLFKQLHHDHHQRIGYLLTSTSKSLSSDSVNLSFTQVVVREKNFQVSNSSSGIFLFSHEIMSISLKRERRGCTSSSHVSDSYPWGWRSWWCWSCDMKLLDIIHEPNR